MPAKIAPMRRVFSSVRPGGNCETCQVCGWLSSGYVLPLHFFVFRSTLRYPNGPPHDAVNLCFTSPVMTTTWTWANTSCPVYSIIASHSYTSPLYPCATSCHSVLSKAPSLSPSKICLPDMQLHLTLESHWHWRRPSQEISAPFIS
jgi:hypothetical protein